MVKVTCFTQQDAIHEIHIYGHAESADEGQDLICAGVSSISVGMLNALDEICEGTCDISMNNGNIKIKVVKDNESTQILLKTLYIQLLTMEEAYDTFIKITKVEV